MGTYCLQERLEMRARATLARVERELRVADPRSRSTRCGASWQVGERVADAKVRHALETQGSDEVLAWEEPRTIRKTQSG